MGPSFDMLSSTSKTEQIMAKYRPIAPRPQMCKPPNGEARTTEQNLLPCVMGLSSASAQSIFITKPVRGRKRRTAAFLTSPTTRKVKRQDVMPNPLITTPLDPDVGYPRINFVGPPTHFRDVDFVGKLKKPISCGHHFFDLSLLPYSSSRFPVHKTGVVDMGFAAHRRAMTEEEEKELRVKQHASTAPASRNPGQVIAPQPVRLVGSSISVTRMCECDKGASSVPVFKRLEELEEEVESESLPAVVSDSNNRVRLVNSAYKELVGQPECSWLESLVSTNGKRPQMAAKRINGGVVLLLSDCLVPFSSNAFSCGVEIEWTSNGHKCHTAAACDVTRLSCDFNTFLFTWRFRVSSESCEAVSNM